MTSFFELLITEYIFNSGRKPLKNSSIWGTSLPSKSKILLSIFLAIVLSIITDDPENLMKFLLLKVPKSANVFSSKYTAIALIAIFL